MVLGERVKLKVELADLLEIPPRANCDASRDLEIPTIESIDEA
jgi:hypothetical protein